MSSGLEDLDHVASLREPVRRAVYQFVVGDGAGVDRNQVASGLGLGRSLAAYHLDRLVEDGLLVARFEHRGERRGPGSGRPSKVYVRADAEFGVSVPPRTYGLAAEVMANALEQLDQDAVAAVTHAAAATGRRLREQHPASAPATDPLVEVEEQLSACGYEPYRIDGCVRLRNCPFDALADRHRDLVCTMNLALLEGMLGGDDRPLDLELAPAPGECCVAITPRPS